MLVRRDFWRSLIQPLTQSRCCISTCWDKPWLWPLKIPRNSKSTTSLWKPVPGLHHPPSEKGCNFVQPEFSMVPFVAIALLLILSARAESACLHCLYSSHLAVAEDSSQMVPDFTLPEKIGSKGCPGWKCEYFRLKRTPKDLSLTPCSLQDILPQNLMSQSIIWTPLLGQGAQMCPVLGPLEPTRISCVQHGEPWPLHPPAPGCGQTLPKAPDWPGQLPLELPLAHCWRCWSKICPWEVFMDSPKWKAYGGKLPYKNFNTEVSHPEHPIFCILEIDCSNLSSN